MYLGSDLRHSWTCVVNHLPFIYHNSSSLPAFPLPEFLSSNYFCADSSSDVILFLAQKSADSLNSLPWATFSPPSPSIFWHLLGGQNASRQQTEERKHKRGSNAKYLYFFFGRGEVWVTLRGCVTVIEPISLGLRSGAAFFLSLFFHKSNIIGGRLPCSLHFLCVWISVSSLLFRAQ